MSMKKWRKLVSEKAKVEQQNDNILTAIKNNKINKEFGQLSGEELFKPITSRLDKRQEEAAPKEEEEEVPDYGMEDFDLNNPFDEDFKPDVETPPPSPPSLSPSPSPSPTTPPPPPTSTPPPSPTSTPLPPLAEEELMEEMEEMEEEEQPSKSGVKPQHSKWGPPKEPGIKGSESVDLQTLSSMLTKNKDNPGFVVKSKKSKFYGYTLADIKEAREEILDRRKGNKQPSGVNPTPHSEVSTVGVPHTPKVKPQEEPQDWEMEGSGSVDPNALVERLHLSLASIQAGNTSLKLKKQVKQILGLLVRQNEITQKQAHKILSNII